MNRCAICGKKLPNAESSYGVEFCKVCARYEQKLAEKDKEIERLKNQKAIEELEKLKSYIGSEIEEAKVLLDPIEYEDYHELLGIIRGYELSLEMVDKQIKKLKGE